MLPYYCSKKREVTKIIINILTFLQDLLKGNFESLNILYKLAREDVRKHFCIPLNDKLWFNGFNYKTVIFINKNGCLEDKEIPIQRMIWVKSSDERVHIYLYPSFVIKHYPFDVSTMEFIWKNCIIPKVEPFDIIMDPNNLIDSSIPLEFYSKKIFDIIGSPNYTAKLNNSYYESYQALPIIADKELLSPDVLPSKYAYNLIKLHAKSSKMQMPNYEYLSYANFHFSLR